MTPKATKIIDYKWEEIVVAMGDAHVIFHKKNRNFRYIWLYHHSAVECNEKSQRLEQKKAEA